MEGKKGSEKVALKADNHPALHCIVEGSPRGWLAYLEIVGGEQRRQKFVALLKSTMDHAAQHGRLFALQPQQGAGQPRAGSVAVKPAFADIGAEAREYGVDGVHLVMRKQAVAEQLVERGGHVGAVAGVRHSGGRCEGEGRLTRGVHSAGEVPPIATGRLLCSPRRGRSRRGGFLRPSCRPSIAFFRVRCHATVRQVAGNSGHVLGKRDRRSIEPGREGPRRFRAMGRPTYSGGLKF